MLLPKIIAVSSVVLFPILYVGYFEIVGDKNDTEETFQATYEWKEVKKGQKVSPDLDWRINLNTGREEAKLPEDYGTRTPEEQDEILKKDLQMHLDLNKPENLPKTEKTMEDIGDKQHARNLETLKGLFERLQKEEKQVKRHRHVIVQILQEIHHLVRKTGNGNDFCDLDGFKKIIYKQLCSTDIAIRHESLKLFSVLAQYNPVVKKHILETGGIPRLLKMLYLEKNNIIQNSVITTLRFSLRAYPEAQYKFMETGGLITLTELFKNGIVLLNLGIVTLLKDLMIENHNYINSGNREFIDINQALFNLNWCNLLNEFLNDLIVADRNDFESIETCLMPMGLLANKCQDIFKNELLMFFEQHITLIERQHGKTLKYYEELKSLVLQLAGDDKDEL